MRDEYLVSRWAWVLGVISFGVICIYVALLFSFAYFGIAKVSGVFYPWREALVASLFIPLFATELPRMFVLRLLGGAQFALALTIGIGTFFSFLQRRLFVIRTAAIVINDKLVNQDFQAKFSILGTKLAASPANSSQMQTQGAEEKSTVKKKGKQSS